MITITQFPDINDEEYLLQVRASGRTGYISFHVIDAGSESPEIDLDYTGITELIDELTRLRETIKQKEEEE